MDLGTLKLTRQTSQFWIKAAILICFLVASGLLIVSAARDRNSGTNGLATDGRF